ncbi:MAG: EAL domain-containing protein [Ilumatobacter sp.]|uniref:putative bifunctional diguanylate cyclase/phosphodiesterase n=1 Tax=Ilumatobacter sp. TaxID=1967498 RepID=UPI0026250C29|nr:EAL domain-containing protein [Ilumatobacter sp.]MDJ0770797.1 EAL domain-containing protein [Ilumatobacter sp.]
MTTLRYRGASLAARLSLLVLVPSVALGILAVQRIQSEWAAADRAVAVADAVELQQDVAAVFPTAQLEQVALEGLGRVDALGFPRDVIVSFVGIDFETTYETNLVEFENALDELQRGHRFVQLDDGTLLGDQLNRVRGALDVQRQLSAESRAAPADIRAVFDDLYELLGEALAVNAGIDASSLESSARQLEELAGVMVSAGSYGDALLDNVLYGWGGDGDDTGNQRAVALALHGESLSRFEATLTSDERGALRDLRTRYTALTATELDFPESLDADLTAEPSIIAGIGESLLAFVEYADALGQFTTDFNEGVAVGAQAESDAAEARVDRTAALLAIVAVATVALMATVLYSVLVPIRRLRRRARDISNGVLDADPLPVRGPADIRALTMTVNEMSETLHRVNGEIDRLAANDLDGPIDLPGSIGVSMRESVRNLSDVTTRLHQSEQMSSAIVSKAADAIWTVDEVGIVLTANEASADLTGVAVDDQLGRPIGDFLSTTDGEGSVRVASGAPPRVLVGRSTIEDEHEQVSVLIAHDISERSRFEERLAYQANHDALTGLPNRFAVLEHLDQRLAAADDNIAVLFIDLDSFKSVNDAQGHAAGDRVLTDIAATLSKSVREGEFVGRLGGDEFIVVSEHFSQTTDVVALGHRIIREVEQPRNYDGQLFVLSASVGVTVPEPGTSALDALRQADNAVYQAKQHGRGRVEFYDATMQERVDREAELELALRHAVRNEELVLHLQPTVDLTTSKIDGAEALVRWNRPGHGMVPPGDFIPLAERSSLVFEIERWVLTKVCRILVDWRDRQPDVRRRIAVNISGRHLIEGDLLADVDAALSLTGADPQMLELELTETQLLEDLDQATEILEALRGRGITIAVDDFGTGYSSMTYLRHLPIDAVKIDRSFVARATEHGYDSTVIEALLTIGRTLNLTVVAEGIETDEQFDYLQARGCNRAQGFLLARPMPVDQAEEMIFADELSVRE